ncbi:DUF6745 domain-containing protein [Umezawaea endophytica]|uniref:DUF6745 domain-containing protein n=1 Tax=Umezawaea endophytica TaxID=1654476 RepID=A0A9X3AG91_9PSEU|nr:hypothetical protein [Umezawaea endophytica]MCS7478065.1 hypothetical protein [Umezawaea endophytica]
MSARRGRTARPLALWWRAVTLRSEWFDHALSTAPADRQASEDAITDLYALVGRPRPSFVWVDSPAAAQPLLPPSAGIRSDLPLPLESLVASLVSSLRERLDRRIGADRDISFQPPDPPLDPVASLRSGVPLRTVLEAGVRDPLRRTAGESVAGAIRAALPERSGLVWYGQHEAAWVAHYDVHRRVGVSLFGADDLVQLELWATIARSCGWWWPREGVCVVAERPAEVHVEPVAGSAYGESRLHRDDGPAVVFRDGWSLHAWHGTAVPSWVVESPTVDLIAAEPNVEVRRCAIEHLGWAEFIERAGLTLVSRSPDPGNPDAELRLYDLPYQRWGSRARLLLAVNGSVERDGTRRRYGLRVPPWFDDPIDAAGWSYGLTGPQYAQLQRRT